MIKQSNINNISLRTCWNIFKNIKPKYTNCIILKNLKQLLQDCKIEWNHANYLEETVDTLYENETTEPIQAKVLNKTLNITYQSGAEVSVFEPTLAFTKI